MLFRGIPERIATMLISACIVLMLMAMISYVKIFLNVMKKTDGFKKEF